MLILSFSTKSHYGNMSCPGTFTELVGARQPDDNRQALGKLDERFRLQHEDRSKGREVSCSSNPEGL